jgi:hypothetical protein
MRKYVSQGGFHDFVELSTNPRNDRNTGCSDHAGERPRYCSTDEDIDIVIHKPFDFEGQNRIGELELSTCLLMPVFDL